MPMVLQHPRIDTRSRHARTPGACTFLPSAGAGAATSTKEPSPDSYDNTITWQPAPTTPVPIIRYYGGSSMRNMDSMACEHARQGGAVVDASCSRVYHPTTRRMDSFFHFHFHPSHSPSSYSSSLVHRVLNPPTPCSGSDGTTTHTVVEDDFDYHHHHYQDATFAKRAPEPLPEPGLLGDLLPVEVPIPVPSTGITLVDEILAQIIRGKSKNGGGGGGGGGGNNPGNNPPNNPPSNQNPGGGDNDNHPPGNGNNPGDDNPNNDDGKDDDDNNGDDPRTQTTSQNPPSHPTPTTRTTTTTATTTTTRRDNRNDGPTTTQGIPQLSSDTPTDTAVNPTSTGPWSPGNGNGDEGEDDEGGNIPVVRPVPQVTGSNGLTFTLSQGTHTSGNGGSPRDTGRPGGGDDARPGDGPRTISNAGIVGAAVGSFLVVFLLILFFFLRRWRARRREGTPRWWRAGGGGGGAGGGRAESPESDMVMFRDAERTGSGHFDRYTSSRSSLRRTGSRGSGVSHASSGYGEKAEVRNYGSLPSPPPMMAQVRRHSGSSDNSDFIPVFTTPSATECRDLLASSPPGSPPGVVKEEKRFSIQSSSTASTTTDISFAVPTASVEGGGGGANASFDSPRHHQPQYQYQHATVPAEGFKLVHHHRQSITSMDVSIRTGGFPLDSIAEEKSVSSHVTMQSLSTTYSQPSAMRIDLSRRSSTVELPERPRLPTPESLRVRAPEGVVTRQELGAHEHGSGSRNPFGDPNSTSPRSLSPPYQGRGSPGYYNPSCSSHSYTYSSSTAESYGASTTQSHANPFHDGDSSQGHSGYHNYTSSVSHAGESSMGHGGGGGGIEMEMVVQQSFMATAPGEISVDFGDRVVVLESLPRGMVRVERILSGGVRDVGVIPVVCLEDGETESVSSYPCSL